MKLPDSQQRSGSLSRRAVLTTAAALSAAQTTPVKADNNGSVLAYVGSYTPNGDGIYLFRLSLSTGEFTQLKVVSTVPSPSWMAIHPQGRFLYAVNEISNFNGSTSGSVSAFSINRANGDLTFLNVVSSQGGGPAHLSVDPLGQYVFVANYGGGSIAVLPIQMNGSLGNAADVHLDVGSVGPTKATNAPPGSFAISGHDAPHAHMIQTDPAGKYVFSTDLGQDRIYSWVLNRATGVLTPNNPAFTSVPPGDGPRHFVFHPNSRWFYSLQEEASTILFFSYNSATGALTQRQMISSLPPHFTGTDFTSEIRISPDGRVLYAANRLHDTIASFAIDNDGSLDRIGETATRGDYPRSFTIDPTGSYLVCCNQRSDDLTTFSLRRGRHNFEFTGQYTPVGSPAIVVFLT